MLRYPLWLRTAGVAATLRRFVAGGHRQRTLRRLEYAVTHLPKPAQQVFLLHRIDGAQIPAIAARMNLSPEEVETLLIDALIQLAGAIDEP